MSLCIAFTYCNSLDDDALTLYLFTHLSNMAIFSLDITKVDGGKAEISIKHVEHRALYRKLQQLHQDYDRQENLGGLSFMKTWGLASMPSEGLISICVSTHPGDMPEYVIPSLEKSTIIFASDTSEDQTDAFPWQSIPAVWDVSTTQKTILEAIFDYANMMDSTPSEFSRRIRGAATAVAEFLAPEHDSERTTTFDEACGICEDVIPFESLTEASCRRGHQCSKSTYLVQTSVVKLDLTFSS